MTLAVIGLGSSAPDALDQLRAAIAALEVHPHIARVVAVSRAYESPASGGATSSRFINACAVVETALAPRAFLAVLHAIEFAQGRARVGGAVANRSRTLDLDLLWLVDGATLLDVADAHAQLTVPHPRALERSFVVVPAVDALTRAHVSVPHTLLDAARSHATAPLFARDDAGIARP